MFAVSQPEGGPLVVLDGDLGVRSFTTCVVLPVSSRDELPGEHGVSHLLEHVVMSAATGGGESVSDWATEVGGQANASTAKESVAYWVRVPPEAATESVRRLVGAVAAPDITDDLVVRERRVIVQELRAAAADLADRAVERFYRALFPDHPLGRPVGGEIDFPQFAAREVSRAHRRGLALTRPCVAMVGPDDLLADGLRLVEEIRAFRGEVAAGREPAPRTVATVRPADPALEVDATAEYAVVACGGRGASRHDPLWAGYEVLTAAIGGLPGSVLYRRLRELGMSYEIYSHASPFCDSGAWRVMAGCEPGEVEQVEQVVRDCLREAAAGRLPAAAVRMARSQAIGATLLDNEDPVVRAHLNAYHAVDGLLAEPPTALALRRLEVVDGADVAAAASRVLESYTCVAIT